MSAAATTTPARNPAVGDRVRSLLLGRPVGRITEARGDHHVVVSFASSGPHGAVSGHAREVVFSAAGLEVDVAPPGSPELWRPYGGGPQ